MLGGIPDFISVPERSDDLKKLVFCILNKLAHVTGQQKPEVPAKAARLDPGRICAKAAHQASLLGAYEEERADPRMEMLEVVADMFKLTLDELLRKDLSEGKGSYLSKRRAQKLASGPGDIPLCR